MSSCLIDQNLNNDNSLPNHFEGDALFTIPESTDRFFNQNSGYQIFPLKFDKMLSKLLYFQRKNKIIYFIAIVIFIFYILIEKEGKIKKMYMNIFDDSKYRIEITGYEIIYDINNDSTMNVTENITINYQGIENTGFRRLIPVNNGVQIRNVRIGQITHENNIEKVYHKEYYEGGDLVLDIGDDQLKYGKNESYYISYEFRILNKKIEKESMLPLNVIGYEWKSKIYNANVQLQVPFGFTEAKCFKNHHDYDNFKVVHFIEKTMIFSKIDFLNEFEGVTFDLHFSKNMIKSYVDYYPVYYLKIIIFCLIVINIIGFIVYRNYNKVLPVRYTSALNTMDPLIMSKVLNGSVRRSDVTSIIFYWASEGYLSINFDNENDPILIKNVSSLPDSSPPYQTYMFNELFKNGKVVKTSDHKFKFYKTINKVIKMVDSQTTNFVNVKSIILSAIFAAFGGIWSLVAPLNLKGNISEEFEFSTSPFIIFFICQGIIWIIRYYMTYHYILNEDYYCQWLLIGFVCLFYFCLYLDSIPSFMISNSYKFILFVSSTLCVISSVSLITKTSYFMAKIGEVFGFKQFIEHPSNDEFESFIKKDPELYYNLLCYSQVLGLTDKWKHKFDNLSYGPPQWMQHTHYDHFYLGDFNMINHRITLSRTRMFHYLVVSPQQRRSSGHRNGHSSHSHGGHGFGGGGGHGR